MKKAIGVLALAALLFAGAGLVGCRSASGSGSAAACAFCTKTGMECKTCKPGENCASCTECAKCPDCSADKACTKCMDYMKANLAK